MPSYSYKGYDFEVDHTPTEQEFAQMSAYVDSLPPKGKKNSLGEEALATAKQTASNIGNLVVTTPNMLAGGVLNKFADITGSTTARELGDTMFSNMERTNEAMALDPENAPQSMVGKVTAGAAPIIGAVAMGGGAIPAMVASGFGSSGQNLVKQGVDSTTAAQVAGIDTAGNLAGAFVPGGRFVQALANPVAGAGTDYVNQQVLDNLGYGEVAKQYNPLDPERRLTDMAVGAVLPPNLRNRQQQPQEVPKPQVEVKPQEQPANAIRDQLLTAHGERLVKSIKAYDEQITKLNESGTANADIVKLIQDLEVQRDHDVNTLALVKKTLDGEGTSKIVEKEVARVEAERQAREQRQQGFVNKKAALDETIPLEAYARELSELTEVPVKPRVDSGDAELRALESIQKPVEEPVLHEQPPVDTETPLPKIEGLPEPADAGVVREGTWVDPNHMSPEQVKEKQQAAILERMDNNVEAYNRETQGFTLEELRARGIEPKQDADIPIPKEQDGFGYKDPLAGLKNAMRNIETNTRELKKLQDILRRYEQGQTPSGTIDPARIDSAIKRHEYFIDKFSKLQDYYQAQIKAQPIGKEVKLEAAKTVTEPTKYTSVEDLINANEGTSTVSKALLDNPDLVRQVPKTQMFFDKRLPLDTQNMVRSLLSLTQMGKDRVIILMDNSMAPAGRALIEGNTTIIRLNPDKTLENLQHVESTSFFNKLPGAQQLRSSMRMVNDLRYYSHEIGHAIFFKYIRDSVTHLDDLKKMYSDWEGLVKTNKGKFEINSLFDASKDQARMTMRENYQSNFSEYFAERVARQLLHKHVLGKFTKYKAIEDIRKVINASADYLKGKGIDLNRTNFTDSILKDIMSGNKDYIKSMSQEAASRVKLLQDDAALSKAMVKDSEAFPFYKKTTQDVRNNMENWSLDPDPMLEGLGHGQSIFPSGKSVGDNMQDPNHRPMSIQTIAAMSGHWITKNFFGKNYVAQIFKDVPEVKEAYKVIRGAEREASAITSKQWFGEISRKVWDSSKMTDKMSKVKLDNSAYNILKKATNEDAATVKDLFETGFREELDYKDNLDTNGKHLTQPQLVLYNKMSELFASQYSESVRVQESLGKNNILPQRKGWFPAVRTGPYSVSIGFGGDTLHRQHFRSKAEAQLFIDNFNKSTKGEFDVGTIDYIKDSNPITQDMFKTVEMVENIIQQQYGSLVAGPIHDRIEASLQKVVTAGGKLGSHHNFRSNLSGYLGSELFHSKQEQGESFKRAIQNSVNEYAGGLRNLIITTKSDMMLKQLSDSKHPHYSVVEEMLLSAKNRTENKAHAVDAFVRNQWDSALRALTGEIPANGKRSFDSVYNAGLEVFYLTKLMSKMIFPVNQALAFGQSIRQMSYEGGFVKPYLAMGKGIFDLISNNAELKQQLYEVSTKTNTFEPQFIENLHLTTGNSNLWEGVRKYAFFQGVNESADSVSRVIAFSGAYRMFRDMGMTADEAQTRAIDITDLSMVPYGRSEVAPIFNKAGLIGQSMKPLQTFGQAQLGNVISDLKHLKTQDPKTWAPFVNYALVSTMMAGAVSLVFVQEYEMLRRYLNSNWPDTFKLPSVYDIIKTDTSFVDRVVTTPEEVQQAMKITAQYGLLANTGVDVMSSSRANETLFTILAAAITGSKDWYEMAPLLSMGQKSGSAVATLAQIPFADKKAAETRKAMSDLLPAGHLNYGAKELAGVNTTRVASPGGYRNTNQIAGGSDNDAITTRTTADIVAGLAGTKSTKERVISDVTRVQTESDKVLKDYRDSLVSKFMDTGNVEYVQKLKKTGMTDEAINTLLVSKGWKRTVGVAPRAAVNANGDMPTTVDALRKLKNYSEAGLYK
jgi:hypothetical protein